jgi:hypothetical protein
MTWPPEYVSPVRAVVWHHTATSNDYAEADVPKILRSIYHFQAVSRGWGDIGYNVLVDRFGRLWEGRAGGLARPVVGAHAGGFNSHTAGIAVIGDHQSVAVPAGSVEAAARYIAWRLSLGPAADPRGQTQLTGGGPLSRFPANTTVTVPRVYPHRQTSETDCPGEQGMKALGPLRDRAYALLGSWADPAALHARLAVWRPSDATWRVQGVEEPAMTGRVGDLPAPADFDGDGATDLTVWTPATGTWTIRYSATNTVGQLALGHAGDRPLAADLDGDGRAEPVTWTPATGMWHRVGQADVRWGLAADLPVPADYNGDGRDELAVWRPSDGGWYRLGLSTLWWGGPSDVPVPADYNGDGRADFTVWSPATRQWRTRASDSVVFGAAGDVPVPARYTGDGRAHRAVWQPGRWAIENVGEYAVGLPGDVPVPLG